MPRKHRKMKGGFLDSITSTLTGWGESLSQGATTAWNKTKNATMPNTYSSPTSTYNSNTYPPTMAGGRKRRKSRRKSRKSMRGGGFTDNTPTTGLASTAASISGIKSPQAHNLVGGRKTRRRRRH
jgi:hypothetical protein